MKQIKNFVKHTFKDIDKEIKNGKLRCFSEDIANIETLYLWARSIAFDNPT